MANQPYYDLGLHVAQVISQALTESKTGTIQLLLRVKILGVPSEDGQYVPHRQQYERSIYMALTQATMPFVTENLAQLGFLGKSLSQLDPSHPQHQSFVGDQVHLWCKHEEYNGSLREKWNISTPREIVTTPVDAKKLRQLDALFGKSQKPPAGSGSGFTGGAVSRVVAAKGGKKPPPASYGGGGDEGAEPVDPSDPGITDDDIPF